MAIDFDGTDTCRITPPHVEDKSGDCLYDGALTPGQIARLAKRICPLQVRPDHLVAYWPMDEQTGVN